MAQALHAVRKRKLDQAVNSTIEPEQGISLIPAKKKKTTNFSKCVVCQQTGGKVFKGKQASRNKFLNAARLRGDDIESDLSLFEESDVYWHKSCYATYTSRHNLNHIVSKTSVPEKPTDVNHEDSQRSTRSTSQSFNPKKCIFCKRKSHNGVRDMIHVSTTDSCNTIKVAAYLKGDEDMLRLVLGINADFMAAAGQYHKSCHASYKE